MRLSSRLSVLPLVAWLGAGCGLLIEPSIPYDPGTAAVDAGVDAPRDVVARDRPAPPRDVGADVAADVPTDVPADASADGATDAATDAAEDVPGDLGLDVPMDAPTDAPLDAAPEASMDVPVDAPTDVPPDAVTCVPESPPVLVGPLSGSMVRSRTPTLRIDSRDCPFPVIVELSRDRGFTTIAQSLVLAPLARTVTPTDLVPGVPWFWRARYRGVSDPVAATSVVNEFRVAASPVVTVPASPGVFGTLIDGEGDGIPDLVIGIPGQEAPETPTGPPGRVLVFPGRAGFARTTAADAIVLSPPSTADPGSRVTYGARITGTGDVNGDGYPDLLVASRGSRLFLHYGSATGFARTASRTLTVPAPTPRPPVPPVAGVGDFDRDGLGDLVVGVPQTTTSSGGTYVIYRGGPLPGDHFSEIASGGSAHLMGVSVAPAGDVDTDGFGDFVLGCPVNPMRTATQGRAIIVNSNDPQIIVTGNAATPVGPDFGSGVASAGDLSGDGRGDVAMLQPSNPQLWYVDPAVARTTPVPLDVSNTPSLARLTPVGDVNGDGRDDLVRWSPGSSAVVVRTGVLDLPAFPLADPTVTDALPLAVAGVGDVDNDGTDEVAVTWRRPSDGGVSPPTVVTVFRVVPGTSEARVLVTFTSPGDVRFGAALGTVF